MLEVLRELPKLVSELLEVSSVGGRACTYVSPWEDGGREGESVYRGEVG